MCQGKTQEDGEARIIDFINTYDYVVFDEFHSLVVDSLFSDSVFNVVIFFCYCLFKANKKTIILTATRQPVDFFLHSIDNIYQKRKTDVAMLDLTKTCVYVLPEQINVLSENKQKHEKIKKWLEADERIIYFMNFVGEKSAGDNNWGLTIFQEYEFLLEHGLTEKEIAVIVSKSQQKSGIKTTVARAIILLVS